MAPPLDPDPGTARRWLEEELANGEYDLGGSPLDWLLEQIARWLDGLSFRPGDSAFTETALWAGGLAVVLVVVVLLLRRYAVPPRRRPDEDASAGLQVQDVSAAEYRSAAAAALAADRTDDAVVAWMRALTREVGDRGLVSTRPGMTAAEVGAEISARVPAERAALERAANLFALARYGRRTGGAARCTVADAEHLRDLDDRLRRVR